MPNAHGRFPLTRSTIRKKTSADSLAS